MIDFGHQSVPATNPWSLLAAAVGQYPMVNCSPVPARSESHQVSHHDHVRVYG